MAGYRGMKVNVFYCFLAVHTCVSLIIPSVSLHLPETKHIQGSVSTPSKSINIHAFSTDTRMRLDPLSDFKQCR